MKGSELTAWKEFMDLGLLWWVNRSLHLLGWTIELNTIEDEEGEHVIGAFPRRVGYRGFSRQAEEEGFKAVTEHLAAEAARLLIEVKR